MCVCVWETGGTEGVAALLGPWVVVFTPFQVGIHLEANLENLKRESRGQGEQVAWPGLKGASRSDQGLQAGK